MAVKIRLRRVGKKKQPTYRVVVADSRSPRDGRVIETIGRYGPREDPPAVEIDPDKALGWLRQGAQPTERAQKLLVAAGVWERFESERGQPLRTKLTRRGVEIGADAAAAGRAERAKAEQAKKADQAKRAEAAEKAEASDPAAGAPSDEADDA